MHIRRETYSIRQMPLTFHTRWMQRWSELMNSSWARKWDGSSCKVRGNLRYRRINCTLASEEGDLTTEFLSHLTSSVPVADSGSAVFWSCVSGPANLRAQHLDTAAFGFVYIRERDTDTKSYFSGTWGRGRRIFVREFRLCWTWWRWSASLSRENTATMCIHSLMQVCVRGWGDKPLCDASISATD